MFQAHIGDDAWWKSRVRPRRDAENRRRLSSASRRFFGTMEVMPKREVLLILGAVVLAAASGSAQSVKGRPKAPPAKTAPAKTQPAAPTTAKEPAPASTDAEPASSAAPAMTGRGEAK